jgi:adenine-specific DNA methylase
MVQATLSDQLTVVSAALDQSATPNGTKLRGGYYTPIQIADFLSRWAVQEPVRRILEPSAGDGIFVSALNRLSNGNGEIVAVELDDHEAGKIRGRNLAKVVTGDFFAWYKDSRPDASFDCVVGNPPFIRYQDFLEAHREPAFELMREEGLHPTRLTNAWLPFVVVATRSLRPGGRLALVLPAELLQVGYAAELREYLVRKYSRLTIVTFRRLVFDGIEQETILLLGVREDAVAATMSFVECNDLSDLESARLTSAPPSKVDLDHAREKWTQYYLSPHELELIRQVETTDRVAALGDYAEVDVGVVTGRNEFFVFSRDDAIDAGVLDSCLRLVGRSAHIPGLILKDNDWTRLHEAGQRCLLLQLGDVSERRLSKAARAYVKQGEERKIHEGYKCRIRLPHWWKVPSVWVPDAFLLRQIYDGPRIIQNAAEATCTDTIHRVRVAQGVDVRWLAAASVNSLTWAFAEIRGRSYGGGVLELEPSEAEGLPFPKPDGSLPLESFDSIARCQGTEQVLEHVDRAVLFKAGFTGSEVVTLRGIWRKLYERRKSRKRR